MEGLTTNEAKTKLLGILEEYRYLNRKQPVSHVHLYVKSIWFFEILVYIYGLFLILDFILLSKSVESLVIGIFLLLLPLRYAYYKANRSKFQWEIFDDRIKKIHSLVIEQREGEDMSDVTLRGMNNTLSQVFRDKAWVKLPSVVLLEGDLVALRPGMFLPADAIGVDRQYKSIVLKAYEILPNYDSLDILEVNQKVHFIMKDSPAKLLLEQLLTDRAFQKKRTSTFYMICLKLANKIFFCYIFSILALNLVFAAVWSGTKAASFNTLLLDPSFLFLFIMIVVLPSLLHLLTCWGNALLWCICESLDKEKPIKPNSHKKEPLDSILQGERADNLNLFDKKHLAEKAEADFENEEMVSLVPPVQIIECFSICRSFLIGGIQRDLNILDLLNNTTIMSFIDKEGIISENARYADEVIVMGPEGKITALDLVHESPLDIQCGNSDHDQIAFIGNASEEHLESLKPLGLATAVSRNPRINDTCKNLINLNDDHPKLVNTGELFFLLPKDEIEIFEECACIIGKLIGFTEQAIEGYEYHCTLWSTWRPNETENLHDISYRRINKKNNFNKDSAVTDYIEKRISQAKRINTIQERLLKPCHLLTSIIEKDGQFQVFSQGNPRVVLQNCKNYWDGNDLCPLEDEYLQKLNTALLQWTADDYDTIAFAYKPLISEEIENVFRDEKKLEDNDEITREILQGVQKGHIFLGMIAITNHPKSEASHFIEDVFHAGIRFVIFSEGDLLETKAFGDDLGLYTAWNSCISLSSGSAMVEEEGLNLDGMKVLPQGIEEIRIRLSEYSDTVPLLVSMFSDSTKPTILEMIKIYQENGEVVTVLGGCLQPQNTTIYQTSDVSIGIKAQPCGFCRSCYGYRINYKHNPGILEIVSEKLISLPCTFTLGLERPLYVVLQVIKEARKLMANIQHGLLFAATGYVCWGTLACALLIFGLPPILTLLQCSYISFVLIPTLALSFLSTPSEPSLMKKLPIKVDILKLLDNRPFFTYLVIRILLFITLGLQTHIWALSIITDKIAFFNWKQSGNNLILVQLCNFWLGALLVCVYSTAHINGNQSWFQVKAVNNFWWLAVVILNMIMATIIVLIYLAIYSRFDGMKAYLNSHWYVYVTIIVEDIAGFFFLELLNFGISNISKSLQKTLDVYFQTKLGIYSPK